VNKVKEQISTKVVRPQFGNLSVGKSFWKGFHKIGEVIMRSLTNKSFIAGIVLTIVVLTLSASYGYEGEPARFGRVSEIDGNMQLQRYNAAEWEYCAINMLIQEGDIVSTKGNSFAEIQFDNGSAICLNANTDIQIAELSKGYAGNGEVTTINMEYGDIYVRIPRYQQTNIRFEVATPTGSILIDDESKVRIKVKKNGVTTILVYEGYADIEAEGGAIVLQSGEKVNINSEGLPSSIKRLSSQDRDRFYKRCVRLDRRYERVGESRRYCSSDIYIGVVDLDYYGHWRHEPAYGYVWVPRVHRGWRPYYHGHWVWTRCGWTWVSYEPWGWVPYHYGRWAYVVGHGWAWVPGSAWGPGWVVWTEGPGWIAWAPLGPYNVPYDCIYIGNRPVSVWNCVYYDSFIKYRYKQAGTLTGKKYRTPGYKYYRNAKIEKDAWRKSPPKVKPIYQKATVALKDKPLKTYVRRDELKTRLKSSDQIRTKDRDKLQPKLKDKNQTGSKDNVRIDTQKRDDRFKDTYKRKDTRTMDQIRSRDKENLKDTDRIDKYEESKTDNTPKKAVSKKSAKEPKNQKVYISEKRTEIKTDRESKVRTSQSQHEQPRYEKNKESHSIKKYSSTDEKKSYKKPKNQ